MIWKVGWPKRRFQARLILFAFAVGLISVFLNQVHVPKVAAAWYGSSWNYRTQLTLLHSQVPNTDQSNFPALISFNVSGSPTYANLKLTTNGGNVAISTGDDIIFTGSDGTTLLNYEIEKYVGSSGELEAWVKIGTLSHTVDTNIYMYYGNASASPNTTSNKQAVWDDGGSNFYKGVWHLPNGSTLTANDSTSNGNNGTITNVTATSGEIDGAGSFNGSNTSINAGSSSSLDVTNNIWTNEAWISRATSTSVGAVIDRQSNGYLLGLGLSPCTTNQIKATKYGVIDICFGTFPSDTNLHQVAVVYSGSGVVLYIDGVSNGNNGDTQNFKTASGPYNIGVNASSAFWWNGKIDEVRSSHINRSADWVKTEYNNQSSPSTFLSTGAEESPPAAPTLSSPTSSATDVSQSPSFSFKTTDANNDYIRYRVYLYQSDCTTSVGSSPFVEPSGTPQTGWTGQDQQTGTAYTGSSSIAGSTMATYTYQGTLNASTTYCWKVDAIDPGGTNIYGSPSSTRTFTTLNNPPATPTLSAPASGATGVSTTPTFNLKTTDADNNYLQYKILLCQDSLCNTVLQTWDQTASQTGWSGQDQQTGTAYTGSSTIGSSTLAVFQPSILLTPNAQYWWEGFAIDPGGSNTWSSASSIWSFTATASQVNIQGGTNINGGATIN